MIFYIFLIAVLNLGLGFAAAMHLRRCYNRLAVSSHGRDNALNGDGSGADSLDDLDEDPVETASNKSPNANSGDPSGPDVVEPGTPPTDDKDEFAADLDALFD